MQTIAQLIQDRNIIIKGGDIISNSSGFTQVPNFILVSKKVSVGAKLTYAMLLKYAWQNNFCYPGQERLAEDIGVTKRSVVTFIKELEKAGFINIERRGQGRPNRYTLNLKPRSKSLRRKI